MEENYRALGCATVRQAVKDYFEDGVDEFMQRKILRDLCSEWMDWLTDGLSLRVAKELKTHPARIYNRLKKYEEEEEQNG